MAAPSDSPGALAAGSQPSVHLPASNRLSVEEYCHQHSSSPQSICTADDLESPPPSYDLDHLLQFPHLRRKFNIQPREDEGREALPPYSCTLSLENVFLRKMEMDGAVQQAHDRNWNRVYVSLQGTALSLHKLKLPAFFSSTSSKSPDADAAVEGKKGPLLKNYNLQHADVGIAADYYKKRYVIRVRAESDQFLLSCFKIETFVHWLQSLCAAIDLALPLDDRPLPRDLSTPRRRRRRAHIPTSRDLERDTALIAEQHEIIRSQYPGLGDGRSMSPVEAEPERPCAEQQPALQEEPASSDAAPTTLRPTCSIDSFVSSQSTQSSTTLSQFSSSSSSDSETPHPCISPETGKWSPEHEWSAMYDMVYVRRCMAVLNIKSPRKSNLIIMKGKQWAVDWTTGSLTRCAPPDYREVEMGREGRGRGGIWSGFRARMAGKV